MFLDLSHSLCLLHVQSFTLEDDLLGELVGHLVLELEEDLEELATEDSEVLLLQQLRVDLRQRIELGVHLVLRDGGLVADQVLQLCDLLDVLGLETLDVGLRDLDIALELQDVDEELPLIGQLILVVFDLRRGASHGTELLKHVEVHGIAIGLLHDLCHLLVQLMDQ